MRCIDRLRVAEQGLKLSPTEPIRSYMEAERTLPSVREAGEHAHSRAVELGVRLFLTIGGSLLVLFTAWLLLGGRGWLLVVIELAAIGVMLGANRWLSPQVDRWLQGARGERQVGAILDHLSEDGWHVLHDVSLGRGNVDHVLVGPGGVFTIETKSHRGRRRVERIDRRMLKQAYAQKKLLERITGYKAQPLLVFSEAWLIGSVPARRDGIVILPARMLDGYVRGRQPAVTPDRAKEFYDRLAVALSGT